MKKYKWVGYSHDTAYEVSSSREFVSEKDAYNNMREQVLAKMKWNTDFEEDFEQDGDTIGYNLMFSRGMIVHHSYSGCYVYIVYDAIEKEPTWEEVFNDERVEWLKKYGIIEIAEIETIKSFKKARKSYSKQTFVLNEETDWYFDGNRRLFAQNCSTKLFENTSWTKGLVMVIFNDVDEADVSVRLNEVNGYEYILYNENHELVGYVYDPLK